MSIQSVDKVWSGESWSDEKEGAREYEELYRVITNNPSESPITIRSAAGIPAMWSQHPGDPAAIVTKRTARRVDDTRLVWEVTVTYEYDPADPDDVEENPLNRPAKVRWTSSLEMRPVIRDRDGDPVVNKAMDYFDPPPEYAFPRWTANIQFNLADWPEELLDCAGAINDAAIIIGGRRNVVAERARMVGLDIGEDVTEEVNGEDVTYCTITLSIECRHADDDPFDLVLLNQGLRELASVSTEGGGETHVTWRDIKIPDDDGNYERATAPVLLDNDGLALADPTPENAVFLTFEMPRRIDFTIFPGITSGE